MMWKILMVFTCLLILYGVLEIVISFVNQGTLNSQALILIVGMGISFLTAREKYQQMRENK